jgi:ABC-type transport system substrate-binding protein
MMIPLWKTKGVTISIIAFLALVACGQPAVQENPATNPAPATNAPVNTAPTTTNPNTSQSVSVDDAAEKVENALDNNPTLKAFDLDADDEGNAIVLTGRVQNEVQRTLAENVAKEVAPGFAIVNRITF